jgi:malate dehydrogenase
VATQTIAILGSGELAATLARRLAQRERARRIVLVDDELGRARGKALDIAQCAPIDGFDAIVEGAPDLPAVGSFETMVVADPADLADGPLRPPERLIERAVGASAAAIVVAAAYPCAVVETLIERGARHDRVLGSAPVAQAAALRRRLAAQLDLEPREVAATVMGAPPHDLVSPHAAATVGGVPIETSNPMALRGALAELVRRAPGPVALAAAAARVVEALLAPRLSVLPVVVCLHGEYGHRGAALAVPARVGRGRLHGVLELPLEPVERVAFDNAAQRRLARRV